MRVPLTRRGLVETLRFLAFFATMITGVLVGCGVLYLVILFPFVGIPLFASLLFVGLWFGFSSGGF